MKNVYSPSGSVEAHMIAHMLEQEGIQSYIHGEALIGGVGDLPAAGLLKIAVADEDYDVARKLILEWEKKSPPQAPAPAIPTRNTPIFNLLLALAAGVALGWFANDLGVVVNPPDIYDQNGDRTPDYVVHYKNKHATVPETAEKDMNFDDKFDSIVRFDDRGMVVSEIADSDFNGTHETTIFFKHNTPVKSEVDADGDGKADIINLYDYGFLRKTQFLSPDSGKVVRVNHYKNSMLTSADFDSDGDGVLETRYTYDRYEQVINTVKN